jgi:S1-C subfamily serine protease
MRTALAALTAGSSVTATIAAGSAGGAAATSGGAAAGSSSFQTAIRDVAERVKPAVVQITNEQTIQPQQFNQQFNQPYTVPAGVGSGVIYDNQGHILTNNHVVEGAEKLVVSLPNGKSFPAKLVGRDPQTDLAVVQVTANNLPTAQLGDSNQLQVGDWVVAIGNALALPGGPTVSQGVVGALGRTVQEPGQQSQSGQSSTAGPFLFGVIQTDAPINPGNSGGPLVNLDGQVVGIDTLVAGQAEPGVQAQGIGFAIAISVAKPIADELVQSGHVTHAYLGISYVPLNPAIAAQMNLSVKDGVVVEQVVANSPAAKAGLQPNDVITESDGQPLVGESALAQATNAHKPGDKITLTVLRNGKQMHVDVTLGTFPQS